MVQIYTSESVSEGHPDKVADQISDALLDAFLDEDARLLKDGKISPAERCRVAIETMLAHGVAVVSGEVTSAGYVDVQNIVRDTIRSIGYTDTEIGFDGENCGVLVAIQPQSPDIAQGVDTGGAGDQGMMFGYASNETPELMPLPISIAHALMRRSVEVRGTSGNPGFRPDAKAQVSVVYEGGRPKAVDTIVVSQQHDEDVEHHMKELVLEHIVRPVLAEYAPYVTKDITYHINPTGRFVRGGPAGDTGLTGRKIIVDTYGGMAPHGGGAFSGKDPTKVDRSAAYMARFVAKTIVAAGLAERCQLALAYAIGVSQPVAVNIETYGTEQIDIGHIAQLVRDTFDMSPLGIAQLLGLREARYRDTARNGHFGNPAFPWEQPTKVEALRQVATVV
ncbi:MAG: methionine adenosyltransferase [Armatimonadetes bacterium]|nr:methionine adenosyltransferase [Armatimonadota bacterium]